MSSYTKAYYLRQKARGVGHQAILRGLAFKWIRILWRCWQTHTPYDEARYLEALPSPFPIPRTIPIPPLIVLARLASGFG